jgi:hypothetical protein
MKVYRKFFLRRALTEQQGQVLPWVALMMGLFLGFGAFVLDVSHAYFCYHELQASTDAAALAAAQSLNSSNPSAVASAWGGVTGGLNSYASLSNGGSNSVSIVPGYPKYACLDSSITKASCVGPKDANAIQVAQQAIVPTFFAKVFGINQMTMSTTSSAAIVGAKNEPTNIAILLDTTASMQSVDSNCLVNGKSAERIVCAESGVATMLTDLTPCNTALGCGSISNEVAANALDQVAIFTFPNVTVGTASSDYDCSSSTNPTIPVYSFPTIGGSTYAPSGSSTATYQVTPFLSDYNTTTAGVTSLVTSSDTVLTTGSGKNSSGTTCPGMQAPGGDGTYYAGAIYAVQAALTAQAASEVAANSEVTPINIMVILSDGEANADSSKMATKTTGGVTVNANNPWPSGGGATSSVTNYPSALDQCQQAVAAANYAKGQGTYIYTIAYGSESSGCTTDSTGPQTNITPCNVMSEMASPNSGKTVYFYSDYNQSGSSSSCVSSGSSITNIGSIFQAIVTGLLQVRLIPNSPSGVTWAS